MRPGNCGNLGNIGNVESVTCRPHYPGDETIPVPGSFHFDRLQSTLVPLGAFCSISQGGFALLGNSCEFNSFVQDCGQGQNFPV